MRILTAVLLPLVVVLLVGCGGESREDAYREAAEQAVRDAVLTLDDLPAGWRPSEIGGAALTGIELTGDCALLNGRGAAFPGEVASADSEPFSGPSDQELAGTVTAFIDEQAAEAAVRLANDLVLQCTDQVEEALKGAIERAAEQSNLGQLIRDIDASVEPGSFTKFGDETVAYRLRADISVLLASFEVNGHIIVIRDGPLTGVLLYAVLGDTDEDDELSVAAALADNLAKAEESLAE